MLFHVTMTHTADNCPAYHPDRVPDFIASMDKLPDVGKQLGVIAHALVWAAPDHVGYAVLEADSIGAVGRYLNSIALEQDFRITPVQHVRDVVQFAKDAAARAKK